MLRTDAKNSSKDVFKLVTEHSPQKAISVADMRKRVKILDVLEETKGDSFCLEDAEWQTLKTCVEEFPWQQASKQLLQVIDDVIEAPEVSRADLKAVDK